MKEIESTFYSTINVQRIILKSILKRRYLDISPELKCTPVHLCSLTPVVDPQFLALFEKAQFGGTALMEEVCHWHSLRICGLTPLPACSLCSLCMKEMQSAVFLLQLPDTMPSHHMSSTLWNCTLKQTVPSTNCFWSWSFIKQQKVVDTPLLFELFGHCRFSFYLNTATVVKKSIREELQL